MYSGIKLFGVNIGMFPIKHMQFLAYRTVQQDMQNDRSEDGKNWQEWSPEEGCGKVRVSIFPRHSLYGVDLASSGRDRYFQEGA